MHSNADEQCTDHRLAPFNPTSQHAVTVILQMMKLGSNDVLVDMGCGDGRLLISAVKECVGLRCIGIEIDPVFVEKALAATRQLNAEQQSRVDIRLQDVLDLTEDSQNAHIHNKQDYLIGTSCRNLDLKDATAIFLYLLPKGIVRVKPLLEKVIETRQQQNLKIQIVTYMFQVHGWTPKKVEQTGKANVPIYLYEFTPHNVSSS